MLEERDARAALEAHHAAIMTTAAADYPAAILEQWAPLPVTDADVARFLDNPEGEWRIVAEKDANILGMAAIVAASNELRACYVRPEAGGKGVGRDLVEALEAEALRQGLSYLQLDSSLTAEAFYLACGYRIVERGEHRLHSGDVMTCVHMEKRLRTD